MPWFPCAPNQKQTETTGTVFRACLGTHPRGLSPGQGQQGRPKETGKQEPGHSTGWGEGGSKGEGPGLPVLEPQTLPGSEGLGGIFQHPEFVEEHHVEDDQQHQTKKTTRGEARAMSRRLGEPFPLRAGHSPAQGPLSLTTGSPDASQGVVK